MSNEITEQTELETKFSIFIVDMKISNETHHLLASRWSAAEIRYFNYFIYALRAENFHTQFAFAVQVIQKKLAITDVES